MNTLVLAEGVPVRGRGCRYWMSFKVPSHTNQSGILVLSDHKQFYQRSRLQEQAACAARVTHAGY